MSNPEDDSLITTGFHLPYDPTLIERAREMRKNPSEAERKLWGYLCGFKYRVLRQRPIDHYIVDFYCARLKIVIEVDGDTHYTDEGLRYDQERTSKLEEYGLRVLRFSNREVLENYEAVCEVIEEACGESPQTPLSKGGFERTPPWEGGFERMLQ